MADGLLARDATETSWPRGLGHRVLKLDLFVLQLHGALACFAVGRATWAWHHGRDGRRQHDGSAHDLRADVAAGTWVHLVARATR